VTLDQLLDALQTRDIDLYLDGPRLRYRAPRGALTPELRSAIGCHRSEIIYRLGQIPPDTSRKRCQICIPNNWRDDAPRNGRIRTTCRVCGRFIGYRPAH
jgi:hypothetical protein